MNFTEVSNHILFNQMFNYELIENLTFTDTEYNKLFIIAFTNNRNKRLLDYLFYKIKNNKNLFQIIIDKAFFEKYLEHIYNMDNNIIYNNYEEIFKKSLINNYTKYTNLIYFSKKQLLFDTINKNNLLLILIFYNEYDIISDISNFSNNPINTLYFDKNKFYVIDVSLIPLFITTLYIPNFFNKELINIPSSVKTIIFDDFYFIHSTKSLSSIPDTVHDIYINITNCSTNKNNIKIHYNNTSKNGFIYHNSNLLTSIIINQPNIYSYMMEFRNIWSCFHYINF